VTVTTRPGDVGILQRVRDHVRVSGPWTRDAIWLLVLVGLLLLVGLVMTLSASFVADAESGDAFATFVNQAQFAGIGLVLFAAAARLHHDVWRPLSWPLLGIALVALLLVVVPGVGYTQYGSTRWLAVGPFIVQPSELAKLATLLWLGDVMTRKREQRAARQGIAVAAVSLPTRHLLVPAVPLLVLQAVLVMLEPDLGTTLLLALIVFLVLWFEGISLRLVFALGGVTIAASVLAIAVAGYRVDRITGWIDPEADPLNTGYQLLQSLYALGNGGWFGTGLGASRGKWEYIPNPETDFIFAIIGEELGLVGALAVVALFTAILVVGLRVAATATDHFARLTAGGVTAWIVAQAFLNIGTVTGLLPITGVTLPLVSVGGSSLVSTLVALGILCSIARSNGVEAVE
jgi:cell division protein FtsW